MKLFPLIKRITKRDCVKLIFPLFYKRNSIEWNATLEN
ncbi:hypothetical protein NIES2104_30850 [Leptolyngbya sp. NIES-2104]|nr:hypothetical protein NIES2104_30850 [Leptolyngbya sp. NIES-2104]